MPPLNTRMRRKRWMRSEGGIFEPLKSARLRETLDHLCCAIQDVLDVLDEAAENEPEQECPPPPVRRAEVSVSNRPVRRPNGQMRGVPAFKRRPMRPRRDINEQGDDA